MNAKERSKQLVPRSSLVCRICGDVARGMNFGVISCMSCKAFFRRNALRSPDALQCVRKFPCEISKTKRSGCAACRLKKCFRMGMKPQLIRSLSQYRLPTPRSLDLLLNDRSHLTKEEWNLFSNIIHIYDEQNFTHRIRCLLNEGLSLPLKLRAKPSVAMSIVYSYITSIEPLIKRSPHFHSLPIDARRTLITQTLYYTSALNSLYINRDVNIFADPTYRMSFSRIFGDDPVNQTFALIARLDPNDMLIKIMLFVIVFSSNYSIVTFSSSIVIKPKSNAIDIIHVQDIYVTLLWKYLLYQYGWKEAVIRYSSLVKIVLDLSSTLEGIVDITVQVEMIETVTKQMGHWLLIED